MTKEGDGDIGTKEMTKGVNEVIEKGDTAKLLDTGKEGNDADGTENTFEETISGSEGKWSQEVKVEENKGGNDSKELVEETIGDINKEVEPECVGEIEEEGDKVEKQTLTDEDAAVGQFELVTKDESTDENSMERKNGTAIKSGTAENILNRREGESGETGAGSEEDRLGKEDDCDKMVENARSKFSSATETGHEKRGGKIEPKSGDGSLDKIESESEDGSLDKLQKLEPIWMKR